MTDTGRALLLGVAAGAALANDGIPAGFTAARMITDGRAWLEAPERTPHP
jgi:hypothetical protein